ncbi:MAG: outer membrane beta-barrel protein [Terracidiphilus sp.]|jgi:opacity protein-like surface antigen
MRSKLPLKLILAALFVAAVFPVYSQVTPAARQGSVPIVVGAGFSDFSLDWGPGKRMEGISAWVDWYPNRLPTALQGLGIEAAGHDINYGLPAGFSRMRQDTGEGGLIYAWNHYRNFRPYVRYLAGIGSIDFPPSGTYSHDTFSVFSPGGGIEYRAWQHIWIRGDYEYQFWHHVFGPHDLNPNGFTIGASYDFRPPAPERR